MKRPWPLGKEKDGLYVLEEKTRDIKTVADKTVSKQVVSSISRSLQAKISTNQGVNKAKLWHLRMGHLPIQKMKIVLPDLNERLIKDSMICTICPMAKQTRARYPKLCIKTKCPLEMLHIDVWGPFRYAIKLNCTMFITIVDDFSIICWIFLINKKAEFTKKISQFVAHVERQLVLKVKCVRTDNAPELTKGEARLFYLNKGIQ